MTRFLRTSFILLIVLSINFSYGQSTYLDSLLAIATRSKVDSNSVIALTHLQRYYFERGLYDSTLKYAQLALPITETLKDTKRQARITYNLGMTYTNLVRYDSAKKYLDATQAYWPIIHDTVLQVSSYNALAILSNYQSDYPQAVKYLLESAAIIDQSKTKSIQQLMPQVYSTISSNLIAQKQYEKGIEYSIKALRLKDYPGEPRYRVILHLDVFDAYLQLNQMDLAKAHLDSAVLFNQPLNNRVITNLVSRNEGVYYNYVKDYPQALASYLKSYQLSETLKYASLKSQAANNISGIYLILLKYEEARKYALEANEIGRRLKQFEVVSNSYGALKQIAIADNDFKTAVKYAELNKIYADSATNAATQKETLFLESKYQNQRKENEIAGLTIANTQHELSVVKRNRFLIGGGILSGAALLILGLLFKTSRQRQLLAEREQTIQREQIKFLERQQQVVSLQSMINGQETERTRIAKDLHDGLGGLFSTVKMYFSSLQHDMPELKEKELFQKSYSLVDSASVEIRRIAHSMMPEVLMRLGLVNALKDLCDNISAGKLIKVSLEVHGIQNRFNANTEIMLYRIIQELLNNIMKHANATEVIIQFIKEAERLSVVVEDNGQGFNTQQFDESKSTGLETVKSRVSYLNGKLSIDSEKGIGTTIMMDFLINE
jgi:signal transduction histidine kinase